VHENTSNAESLREEKLTKVNFYRLLQKNEVVDVVINSTSSIFHHQTVWYCAIF